MREIAIMLSLMVFPSISHANGFKDLIIAGGGDAVRILGVVSVIFALGVMGFCGEAVLGMIDKHKFGKLFGRLCYMFAGILFLKEAMAAANLFIDFLFG